MSPSIRKPKDLVTGLLFLALGAGVVYASSAYNFGTARQMGPGFFPVILGLILCVLAAFMIAGSFFGQATQTMQFTGEHLRGAVLVLVGVLLFGLLIRPAGLPIAIAAMLMVSTLAMRDFGYRGRIVTTAVLAAFSTVVFVLALGQPIPILGSIFTP